MKGILVLDGPDGAGKTYLAEYFQREHNAAYIHLTYRWPKKMFDYHTAAINRAGKLSQDRLVILDRWWMSELCYANVYRNGTPWPLQWRFMQRVLLKYAGVYVYCLPVDTRKHLDDFDNLRKTRDENYMNHRDILPVVLEYHKLWDKVRSWPNIIRYDRYTDGGNLSDFTRRVRGVLEPLVGDQPDNLRDWRNRNVLGHLGLAKYLLVGEQTNPRKSSGGTWWPFYEYAASSLHLTQLLDDLHFKEHEALWCNAFGQPEMAKHLLDRYDLRPICLGGEAYLHVTERKAELYSKRNQPYCFYHPAYDKRFPLGVKYHELKEQLGQVLHGTRSSTVMFRDNMCAKCGDYIRSEDVRDSTRTMAGVHIG